MLTLFTSHRNQFLMGAISEVVDSLEKKIDKLIASHQDLQDERSRLIVQIGELKKEQQGANQQIERLESECESLKLANSMLGSDQYTRETKLKINALVRELDHCIAQLSS
jgi:FtsZ-binding cell division protein ZapB